MTCNMLSRLGLESPWAATTPTPSSWIPSRRDYLFVFPSLHFFFSFLHSLSRYDGQEWTALELVLPTRKAFFCTAVASADGEGDRYLYVLGG